MKQPIEKSHVARLSATPKNDGASLALDANQESWERASRALRRWMGEAEFRRLSSASDAELKQIISCANSYAESSKSLAAKLILERRGS